MYSDALAASRRCGLTEAQKGRFIQMLIDLEPCRTSIGDVMVWCLEHADSAADITECIVESLFPNCSFGLLPPDGAAKGDNEETKLGGNLSISKTLARMFLISDILYNSSAKVPNASYFRKCFESRLPDVFKQVHLLYKSVDGKLKAEQLKQRLMICFRAWEDWAIYPNEYLIKLQNIFLGLVIETDDEADLAGVPLEPIAPEVTQKFTVLDPDVEVLERQPLVQYDGDPLDVDGSPLAGDSEDETPQSKRVRSSIPLDNKQTSAVPEPRLFVPSKWETVDPDIVESQAVTTSSRWELLVDPSPSSTREKTDDENPIDYGHWKAASEAKLIEDNDELDGQPLTGLVGLVAYDDEEDAASPDLSDIDIPSRIPIPNEKSEISSRFNVPITCTPSSVSTPAMSEERRAQLREIELKVLKYQDELEASRRGDKSITETAINKQIQRYRERLLDRLQDDTTSSTKKKNSNTKPKSSRSGKALKSSHREHSNSPAVCRDSRDRSPPRSFRDRDRSRRRSPSPDSPSDNLRGSRYREPPSNPTDSPYRTGTTRSRVESWADPDNEEQLRRPRLPNEELEEGEASDEEDSTPAQRVSVKRKHIRDNGTDSTSPRSAWKRQRSRSPNSPHSRRRRSRSPSPSRKRLSTTTSTNVLSKRR